MTILVTGGSGFLGRHVLAALAESPSRVIALGRRHPGGWPLDDFVRASLDDRSRLGSLIAEIAPDAVIHAAGKTPPASSTDLYLANTRATMHLLESLEAADRPCRVVLAGSAAELGPVPADRLPLDEAHPCRPVDAYGMSKWAATRLGLSRSGALSVSVARIFNPIGPGMPPTQAFGRFAEVLAAPGADTVRMQVGGLAARRDFVDVRDVARALITLVERGRPSAVYHVGTSGSRSVREGLIELIRLSGREVLIDEQPGRGGPSDSIADIGRIVRETGWSPEIAWEQSLADLWADAKKRATSRRVA